MNHVAAFLLDHGYSVLFAWVIAEQAGLPLPSAPVLLAAGALAGTGRIYIAAVIALPVFAAAIADSGLYLLGRQYGVGVLRFICRTSLEPDSCVRRTQISFEQRGSWALVFSKFIPGVNVMTSPLAGISGMPWRRFAMFDGLGALLWSLTYITLGLVFSAR